MPPCDGLFISGERFSFCYRDKTAIEVIGYIAVKSLFNSPENSRRAPSGFTLFEMVVVLGVLGILGAVVFAFFPAAKETNRKARAAGDLMVIQQGLEAYRSKYGDYPRYTGVLPASVASGEEYLLNALNGRFGPKQNKIDVNSMLNNALLVFENPDLPFDEVRHNRIIDPWRQPYLYEDRPKNAAGKFLFGYLLYSTGPDKVTGGGDDIYAK